MSDYVFYLIGYAFAALAGVSLIGLIVLALVWAFVRVLTGGRETVANILALGVILALLSGPLLELANMVFAFVSVLLMRGVLGAT